MPTFLPVDLELEPFIEDNPTETVYTIQAVPREEPPELESLITRVTITPETEFARYEIREDFVDIIFETPNNFYPYDLKYRLGDELLGIQNSFNVPRGSDIYSYRKRVEPLTFSVLVEAVDILDPNVVWEDSVTYLIPVIPSYTPGKILLEQAIHGSSQ